MTEKEGLKAGRQGESEEWLAAPSLWWTIEGRDSDVDARNFR